MLGKRHHRAGPSDPLDHALHLCHSLDDVIRQSIVCSSVSTCVLLSQEEEEEEEEEIQSDEHHVNPPDANACTMKLTMSNKSDNEQIRIFCQSVEQVFIEEDFLHGQRRCLR